MVSEAQLAERVAEAHSLIDQAVAEYNPVKVFALFSGGNDSLVNTHVISQHSAFSGVLHFDTRVGVRRTQSFVRETCQRYGWPLWVYKTPTRYADLVKRYGFPGPAGHRLMYQRLKDRCVYMALKEHKTHRLQKIAFCSGIRQSESQRRMGYTNPIQRYRSQIWVNPIFHWSKDELTAYRKLYGLVENPVSVELGMSGECLCGAYAKPGELARLKDVDRVAWRYVRLCESLARSCGHGWGWEQRPPSNRKNARAEIANAVDFQPLCSSCNIRNEQAAD